MINVNIVQIPWNSNWQQHVVRSLAISCRDHTPHGLCAAENELLFWVVGATWSGFREDFSKGTSNQESSDASQWGISLYTVALSIDRIRMMAFETMAKILDCR